MRSAPPSRRSSGRSPATPVPRSPSSPAIRLAADGGTYLNPRLGARLAATPPPAGPPDDLSEREIEVLRLIALGHTNGEIASQLYLSVRTIESHRAHIQQKLAMTTRSELVRYAIDRGLIDV